MQDAGVLEAQVRKEFQNRLPSQRPISDYILVLGPTSSGKTTTVRAYVQKQSDFAHAYDNALLDSERFQIYLKGTDSSPVDYLPFEVEALLIRFLQNLQCSEKCIADQSLHSIWAYARAAHSCGLISDPHFQTIVALALSLDRLAPRPSLAVHFHCDPIEARQRLELRNRTHELRLCTIDFLQALNAAYQVVVSELRDTTSVVRLDTTGRSEAEVLQRFEAIVDKHNRKARAESVI